MSDLTAPKRVTLHVADLDSISIYEKLLLEEKLLREEKENFCLISFGTTQAIVLGLGTDPQKVVNFEVHRQNPIPIIQRFSGGGTVVVGPSTLFVTFIFNKEAIALPEGPRSILLFGERLYKPLFPSVNFTLSDQDFTLDHLYKIGGNAHYIARDRWLSHTSFLWDFTEKEMEYLSHPPKEPEYRSKRPHLDFLRPMRPFAPEPKKITSDLLKLLALEFDLVPWSKKEEVTPSLNFATKLL